MSRPTITPTIEKQIIDVLTKDPEKHAVMPASAYRADGAILIYRDNLPGVRAQRHLWRLMIGELEVADYLKRSCSEPRCINPFHYVKQRRSRQGLTHCANGHRYTPDNILPEGKLRCRKCKELADERKRKAHKPGRHPNPATVNASKTECVHGHPFTPENTYVYRGRRACRTCAVIRARERYQNARQNAEHRERKAS
jgi:hypothetical protein